MVAVCGNHIAAGVSFQNGVNLRKLAVISSVGKVARNNDAVYFVFLFVDVRNGGAHISGGVSGTDVSVGDEVERDYLPALRFGVIGCVGVAEFIRHHNIRD